MQLSRLSYSEAILAGILEYIKQLNIQVHKSEDLEYILQETVQRVRRILQSDRLIIYRFLPDGDGVIAEEAVSPGWQPIIGEMIYDPCFKDQWFNKYQQGHIGILNDIDNELIKLCHQQLLTQLQVRANLVVPILVNYQELEMNSRKSMENSHTFPHLWGLLIAHQCSSPRQWHSLEIKLLQYVAEQIAVAIQHTKLYRRIEYINQNLEAQIEACEKCQQIKDCCCSRVHKNIHLPTITDSDFKSFNKLKTPIWIYDIQNLRIYWANNAALDIWNASSLSELLNRDFSHISESTKLRLQNYLQKFQQGESVTEQWTFYPKGQPIPVRCTCSGVQIETEQILMLVEGVTGVVNQIDEETLRSIEILNHTTSMISLYTMEGMLLMQNPATRYCYGDTLHPQLLNENIFIHHFVDPSLAEQILDTIHLYEVISIEAEVATVEGLRWHKMDISCINDPVTGKPSILVNEKDITDLHTVLEERHHVENELRWKEALLRSMTDTSLLAFFVVDNRTDNILYFNHRFCEIWQIEHLEKQMQMGVLKNNDIIPDCIPLIADVPAFAETCKPLQNEENRITIEDTIAFVDGRTIRRFSSQIRDSQDLYFGRLYIFEDITARVQIEEALRQSEERYRTVITSMVEGIVLQHADGQITACNQSAERILGLTADQMMGRTSLDPHWKAIHEDGSPFPGETHPAIITLKTGKPLFDVVMGVHKPDGKLTWISINSQPLFYPHQSQPYAVIASFQDITIRKQAQQALQQQAEQERMIYAIAQHIRKSLNLDEILNTTVAEVRSFLQTDRVIIYRFNPDWSGVVVTESVTAGWKKILNMHITDKYFIEAQGNTYQQNTIKATTDIYAARLSPCHIELLEELQVRAKLVVPILQGDRLWGLLVAHHCSAPREWNAREIELLQQLATQVAIAIQQSELYQQLELANQQLQNLAMVDGLTQIANRRSFDLHFTKAWNYLLREQHYLSLLLCDIDYFKQYNDTYGHAAGDTCLKLVAQALKTTVQRSTDLVARYGGEEFVIILSNTDREGAIQVANKIHEAIKLLQIPHSASAVQTYVTMSIGIATVIPRGDMVYSSLIEAADQALYQAKSQGRNRSFISINYSNPI
ncbi:MAG TPA: diguanylate cyclase [Nostocaceae cyanobacterium]|nr:diguanylate cyclase [Nostocaceae cyanobacterium]